MTGDPDADPNEADRGGSATGTDTGEADPEDATDRGGSAPGVDPNDADSEREDGGEWPVELRGVTESLVATQGPGGEWNLAPLGLRTGDRAPGGVAVGARTWGRTRTRRNFQREGEGVVQFVRDPVLFVDAALGIVERTSPVAEGADAWVRVEVRRVTTGGDGDGSDRDGGTDGGDTEWVDWALRPVESAVERETVPTTNRGYNAVIEATVWASRLGVESYDDATLRDRLSFLADVVDAAGGDRDRTAFDRIEDHVNWRGR